MKRQFDVKHPLFRPLWVRAIIVAILDAWTFCEASNGNWIWVGVFVCATGYLIYEWFIVFDPADYEDSGGDE